MKKTVYTAMVGDFLHVGHINVIKHAEKLGEVVVGVLTDEATASYKRLPFLNFNQRVKVIEHIKGVSRIIPQKTLSYKDNLLDLKPSYVVHGDDWRVGNTTIARTEVIEILKSWGGELIEIAYTEGISSTLINMLMSEEKNNSAHLLIKPKTDRQPPQ